MENRVACKKMYTSQYYQDVSPFPPRLLRHEFNASIAHYIFVDYQVD